MVAHIDLSDGGDGRISVVSSGNALLLSQKGRSIKPISTREDRWFYPSEVENDLQGFDLPDKFVKETYACAWEYARCVIPHFTNWDRYIAFVRITIIATIAEFRGDLVDIAASDQVLGYDVGVLMDTLYGGTPCHTAMGREYRAFLLLAAEKSSNRRNTTLFRRYIDAIARSPSNWYRIRDDDSLLRTAIAAAITCNDINDFWFEEAEISILAEVGNILYDAAAFYKHRAEGETHNTFAYLDPALRQESFKLCRELLWSFDTILAQSLPHVITLNLIRPFGGPIHMEMRRYRYVEDDLMVGRPEKESIIAESRQNVKLWYRVDPLTDKPAGEARYHDIIAREDSLLFEGLAEMLQNNERCSSCQHRDNYGADTPGQFGGVRLCDSCKSVWKAYLDTLQARAENVFPAIKPLLRGDFA
ncbi:Alpha-ionylideneethane synthase aba3 [Paramyrothecium foliicola]|nr:Alpha-ionylideneethane synthase aba3 [Paramyrothecium foliicola]